MKFKAEWLGVVLWAMSLAFPARGLRAGPYTEAGIQNTDPAIVGWASGWINEVRGPMDIANPGAGNASYGSPDNVLGPATCSVYDVISLGDGGELTLTFDAPITDGPGYDLVVFENGFLSGGGIFAELGFVEVSSDGMTFARFPSVSLTENPVGSFGVIDPTDVFYLTGKHPGGNQEPCEGTGFDLADLSSDPAVLDGRVDLTEIRFVKVVDAIGNGSTQDSLGNPIYDPYPTQFASGGCDLQAVGVIHQLNCTDGDGDGYSPEGGGCGPVDCDDDNPERFPGAQELCNGVDDDCDFLVPENESDGDADGYWICAGDCDDGDPGMNPGAVESCTNGKDDDCDGLADSEDPDCFSGGGWDGTPHAEAAGLSRKSRAVSDRFNVLFLLSAPFTGAAAYRFRRSRRKSA